MNTRIRKVLRDLFQERGRALLVLLALIVGGLGVALVTASTSVLIREVRDNFLVTNPLHATITFRGQGDVVALSEAALWVDQAELRTTIMARARGGFDGRLPVVLKIVDDFEQQKISTFELEQGAWPSTGEIVLERDDLTVLGLSAPPDTMQLSLPDGEWMDLPVAGVVHDAGQAPARMEHILYIYLSKETAQNLGADLSQQDLIIRMPPPAITTRQLARGHAELLGKTLEENGYEVVRVSAPEPEQHPHQGQISTSMFILFVFGGMAMLLSGVVVINMISSLMQRHVAQIGVMKTIGGTPAQVGVIYLLMVFALSLVALAINIPVGFWAGMNFASYFTWALNFDMLSPGVPLSGWLFFIGISIALPLLAAAIPVWRGIRVTVRESLGSEGGGVDATSGIATVRHMPIALRNVARRPGRTVLTIVALSIGLGALASAFHVGASMRRTMELETENALYDVSLVFDEPVDESVVAEALSEFDDLLTKWKGSTGGSAMRIGAYDMPGDTFPVVAGNPLDIPAKPLVEGEWRLPPEGRAIIINTRFAKVEKVGLGDYVTLRIASVDSRWLVGGIRRQLGGATQYLLSNEPLGFEGILSASIKLRSPTQQELQRAADSQVRFAHGHGSQAPALAKAYAKYQASVVERFEEALANAGVPVARAMTTAESVAGLEDHIFIMRQTVALASLVILAVGGLGLASTMSVSVLERTREIGVLRSLGATPGKLAVIFASEGAMIGALSLVVGMLVSFPLGRAISDYIGNKMFQTPFEDGSSLEGAAWGAGVTTVLIAVVTLAALVQTLRQSTTAALRHE